MHGHLHIENSIAFFSISDCHTIPHTQTGETLVTQAIIESTLYRMAGYFRRAYISRIAMKFIFAETNFVDWPTKPHLPRSSCSDQCIPALIYDHEDYDTSTASTRTCSPILEGLLCRAEARVEHCHDQSGKN
jgi:hypothetical protein